MRSLPRCRRRVQLPEARHPKRASRGSSKVTNNEPNPRALLELSDDALLEAVQRQTFRFFWEGAHPDCGLARDRIPVGPADREDLVATGGTGFGVMALIVAVERGWVTRAEALTRLLSMLNLLYRATCYHGA